MTNRVVMVYDGTKLHRPLLAGETLTDDAGVAYGTGTATLPIAEADVTNLVSDLAGKAATSHTHAGADITSGTVAIARIPTGTTGTTVPFGNDARFSDARTPLAHTHDAADIASGTIAIARIPTGTTGTTVPFGNDARFSDARTPLAHTHPESDIINLVTDLAAKVPTTRQVLAGGGLFGGGTLASDVTVASSFARECCLAGL